MWEGASVKEGQMRLARGKLSCSCLLSCIPSGEAFFPTPGGGAALLRGYRLGEDRGTQGWGVAHKSSPGGGEGAERYPSSRLGPIYADLSQLGGCVGDRLGGET